MAIYQKLLLVWRERIASRSEKDEWVGDINNWREEVVIPLAKAMSNHIELKDMALSIGTPMGLTCQTMAVWSDGKEKKSITFRSGDLDSGEVMVVDWSVDTRKYPPGTLGWYNQMNFKSITPPEAAPLWWFRKWVV